MTRLTVNRILLKMLEETIESQPDIRFSQALRNLGLVEEIVERNDRSEITRIVWRDDFNLEPTALFIRSLERQDRAGSYCLANPVAPTLGAARGEKAES